MARWIKLPATERCGGKYPHKVVIAGRYETDVLPEGHKLKIIDIPVGYRTDFASVFRLPFMYWLFGGKAHNAAIVHDILHDCHSNKTLSPEDAEKYGTVTHKQCNQIFMEIMEIEEDPETPLERNIMYWAVKIGGKIAWQTDSTKKCTWR